MIPPARDGTPRRMITDRPGRWRRKPTTPPRLPAHNPTVLVALAVTGGIPIHTRVGNVSRLPPPAIEFTKPPATATAATTPCFHGRDGGGDSGIHPQTVVLPPAAPAAPGSAASQGG